MKDGGAPASLSNRLAGRPLIMIDEKSIRRIKNVLCVAEQGVQSIPYGKVEVMADGPDNCRQITLSIGFTQFGGNLAKVIEAYHEQEGSKYGSGLAAYLPRIKQVSLSSDKSFLNLLRKAGGDPVMARTQEEQFEKLYLQPALNWGENEGFAEPFSYLIICDSFLHSGSILAFLRNRFAEKTPAHEGREQLWTGEYLKVRHQWLINHSNPLVRTSSYRTKYYLELLSLDDWELDAIHTIAMNGVMPLNLT